MPKKKTKKTLSSSRVNSPAGISKGHPSYDNMMKNVINLINNARKFTAKSVNAIMTATYWEIGRRIVEFEQKGDNRAEYGKGLLRKLSKKLTVKFGNGFSEDNLERMRLFYSYHKIDNISATSSRISPKGEGQKSISATVSRKLYKSTKDLSVEQIAKYFPLSWSAYVALLSVKNEYAREFYEKEALRGGWSVRQLKRQINAQFYERTALSKNKVAMLKKGGKVKQEDKISPEQEIKDPYILEFLSLKDEYSESDLEDALIHHLEHFLLELGGDFAFMGRQKRLRIGDEWYRVDLLFFHRKLRCLVIIDLKIGKFTYADAGQMHMYLNYAKEHWMQKDENPPVGLILCAQKNEALAKYALKDLPNKVLAAEYKTVLPNEKLIAQELEKTQKALGLNKRKQKQ